MLTVDHIGNPAPGVWVSDESGQAQIFAGCGTIKKKWALLNQIAKERTAPWTSILYIATIIIVSSTDDQIKARNE